MLGLKYAKVSISMYNMDGSMISGWTAATEYSLSFFNTTFFSYTWTACISALKPSLFFIFPFIKILGEEDSLNMPEFIKSALNTSRNSIL